MNKRFLHICLVLSGMLSNAKSLDLMLIEITQ